jgi:hypothetical protein
MNIFQATLFDLAGLLGIPQGLARKIVDTI